MTTTATITLKCETTEYMTKEYNNRTICANLRIKTAGRKTWSKYQDVVIETEEEDIEQALRDAYPGKDVEVRQLEIFTPFDIEEFLQADELAREYEVDSFEIEGYLGNGQVTIMGVYEGKTFTGKTDSTLDIHGDIEKAIIAGIYNVECGKTKPIHQENALTCCLELINNRQLDMQDLAVLQHAKTWKTYNLTYRYRQHLKVQDRIDYFTRYKTVEDLYLDIHPAQLINTAKMEAEVNVSNAAYKKHGTGLGYGDFFKNTRSVNAVSNGLIKAYTEKYPTINKHNYFNAYEEAQYIITEINTLYREIEY